MRFDTPPPLFSKGTKLAVQSLKAKLSHRGVKLLLIALAMLAVGLWLNRAKPIWLAPPNMQATPLLYLALTWAWLPVLAYALSHLISRRPLMVLLIILIIIGQSCATLVLLPLEVFYLSTSNSQDTLLGRGLRCEVEQESTGQTLACQMCLISSDGPAETIYAYNFKYWDKLPVTWLLDADTRYQDNLQSAACKEF